MKKVLFMFLACVVSLVLPSCGGGRSDKDKDKIAELEDSIARMQSREEVSERQSEIIYNTESTNQITTKASDNNIVSDVVGTYKVIDALNNVWIIKLEKDETATAYLDGSTTIHYGSWDNYGDNNGFQICFSAEDNADIVFPNMEKGIYLFPPIKDGYIYRDQSAERSKNPKMRLPIKKIK